MEQHPPSQGWKRWSHWPAALAAGAGSLAIVLYFTRSIPFAIAIGLLLAFLAHGETRRFVRRRVRRPPPGRPWVARPAVRRRVLVTLGIGVAIFWYVLGSASMEMTPEDARSIVQGWGAWGPLLLIAISGLAMLVAPVPNGPFAIAAGLVWGTWMGTVYALLGQLLGATLGFMAARYLGRRFLPRLVGTVAATKIDQVSLSMGPHIVFWTRMAPFVPIDFTTFAAGLTAMRYRIFIAAFMLGSVIPTWIVVWVGDSLHASWTARILSVVVLLIVLAVITVVYAWLHPGALPRREEMLSWRAWVRALSTPPGAPPAPEPEEEPQAEEEVAASSSRPAQ